MDSFAARPSQPQVSEMPPGGAGPCVVLHLAHGLGTNVTAEPVLQPVSSDHATVDRWQEEEEGRAFEVDMKVPIGDGGVGAASLGTEEGEAPVGGQLGEGAGTPQEPPGGVQWGTAVEWEDLRAGSGGASHASLQAVPLGTAGKGTARWQENRADDGGALHAATSEDASSGGGLDSALGFQEAAPAGREPAAGEVQESAAALPAGTRAAMSAGMPACKEGEPAEMPAAEDGERAAGEEEQPHGKEGESVARPAGSGEGASAVVGEGQCDARGGAGASPPERVPAGTDGAGVASWQARPGGVPNGHGGPSSTGQGGGRGAAPGPSQPVADTAAPADAQRRQLAIGLEATERIGAGVIERELQPSQRGVVQTASSCLWQEMGRDEAANRGGEEAQEKTAKPPAPTMNPQLLSIQAALDLLLSLLVQEQEHRQTVEEEERRIRAKRMQFEEECTQRLAALHDSYTQIMEDYDALDDLDILRKKRARLLVAAIGSALATNHRIERRCWARVRSQEWWERACSPAFPPSEFRNAFRMSRATFERLCAELESAVGKEDTLFRAAVPAKKRVAACVWRLATGESLRMVAKRFGLGISTCQRLVLEVCAAINEVLLPKYVQWPTHHEMEGVMESFEQICGIQHVVGAIHTAHVPIAAPPIDRAAYFNKRLTQRNKKITYSITIQATVGPRGSLTDVCIGYPGSMTDSQVLQNSALYQRGASESLEGCWVVGGKSFPLLDWLMAPYPEPAIGWAQQNFNTRLGDALKIARDSFARLKGRWRFLHHRAEVSLQELPAMIGACCVLHNICELQNEWYDPQLVCKVVDDEVTDNSGLHSMRAALRRDGIALTLYPLPQSWGQDTYVGMGGFFG